MNEREPVVRAHPLPQCPESTEYFLPQPDLPEYVRRSLSSWMLCVANSATPALAGIVNERFAHIAHPALEPLSDQLRSYTPISLIVCGNEQSWVRLDSRKPQPLKISPDLSGRTIGSSAYIPSPPNERRIQEQLDLTGFSENAVFSKFAMHFCGLAEDFAISGNFLEGTKNWLILCEDWQEETIANYNQWRGSLLFYHARNGGQPLLHPNGHVGWWKYAERRVTLDFDSWPETKIGTRRVSQRWSGTDCRGSSSSPPRTSCRLSSVNSIFEIHNRSGESKRTNQALQAAGHDSALIEWWQVANVYWLVPTSRTWRLVARFGLLAAAKFLLTGGSIDSVNLLLLQDQHSK